MIKRLQENNPEDFPELYYDFRKSYLDINAVYQKDQ